MDWSQVTSLTIPEGNVEQVSVNGVVLWRKSLLPSGYTQLEYIESTGTQYIDTGVYGTDKTSVHIKYIATETSSQNGFGIIGYQYGFKVSPTFQRIIWTNNRNDQFRYGDKITDTFKTVHINEVIEETFGNGSWIHNGVNIPLETTNSFTTSPNTMVLFGLKNQTQIMSFAKIKLYFCSIEENGTLVRNLIPVMRNSDGKVCMYDTVTRQFFTNAGTGEFIAGPRFVEYIEFDGNSWINTGFTQQTCRIEFGVEFINHNNNAAQLMGFHPSGGGFWGINFRGKSMFYPVINNVNPYQYNDVVLNLDATNTKAVALTLTVGNATSASITGGLSPKTIYVMGVLRYGDGTIKFNNFMKVYYNRIYNANNELIQDLRPCLDPNNVACMYDMVSETYFYNQGTGEFGYGGIL